MTKVLADFAKTLALCGLLLPLAALTGCGGGKGSVQGQVNLSGKPLPAGTITFYCQHGNKEVFNALIRDGNYSLGDIPTGAVKIGIVTVDPARLEAAKNQNPNEKGGGGDVGGPLPLAGTPGFVEAHPRYANPDQTPLEYAVKRGPQTHDIELQP